MSGEPDRTDAPAMPEKLLLFPCGGVEKLTGQLSARIAAELENESVIPNLTLQPSFPQVVTAMDKYGEGFKSALVISLDGCAEKCVSKFLGSSGVKPFASFHVPQLLKGKQYKPTNLVVLSEDEASLVPVVAQELGTIILSLLEQKSGAIGTGGEEFSFNPAYEDWLEYRKTKFIFKVPVKSSGFNFNWNDAWAYMDGERAVIGISDYMQKNIGDVTFVELPKIGIKIDQLETLATVETTKTIVDVISPFSGTVTLVNTRLGDEPELINQEPYAAGWVCVIEPSDINEELENLMLPADYFEFMKSKVDEEAAKQKE